MAAGTEAEAAEAGAEIRPPSNSESIMQPWKISIGLTASILAVSVMIAGESFAYLKPHLGIILSDYWIPVAWYGGLGVVFGGDADLRAPARSVGLADVGRKVDLVERSIRRGEGGQTDLTAKLDNEDRGQFPGA